MITLSLRGGDHFSMEIADSEHVQATKDGHLIASFNLDVLWAQVQQLVQQILPALTPAPSATAQPSLGSVVGILAPAPSSVGSIVSVGCADLDPFGSQGPLPLPLPLPGSTGGQFARPHGGNLIGPDHPMFHGNFGGDGGDLSPHPAPFLPGFDVPQPRFDPFGPPTGPNSDVDVGNVGPWPSRGGGRGRGPPFRNQPFPGEPNPDHFKPPGW